MMMSGAAKFTTTKRLVVEERLRTRSRFLGWLPPRRAAMPVKNNCPFSPEIRAAAYTVALGR
jgi:hypothetical protein